jgi:hypothetical protein
MEPNYTYDIIILGGEPCVNEKYPVIVFNNKHLPLGAVFIDYCASNVFFDIEDELSLWFWKFTICVGRKRTEQSSIVIENATKLKALLVNNETDVKEKIYSKFEQKDSSSIYGWWMDTLNIMIRSAKDSDISEWYGIPTCPK